MCKKNQSIFKYCAKCNFYVCLDCVGLTMNSGHTMEVEEGPEKSCSPGEIEAEEVSIVAGL